MNHRILFPALIVALFFSACDRNIDTRPIPADTNPGITLVAPASGNILRTIGSTADMDVQLSDNEALKALRVVQTISDADGNILLEDSFIEDVLVVGTNAIVQYSYGIPLNVGPILIEPFYKIRLDYYALDTKGASAKTSALINVIPDPAGPPQYLLHSYSGNRMIHPNSFRELERFNFTNRTNPRPTGSPFDSLSWDIMIVNKLPGPLQGKAMISPAGQYLGLDSVFVVTTPERFNYDLCNYRTIREAYLAGSQITNRISPLPRVGDHVIVRLTKSLKQHFAVMKITAYGRDNNGAGPEFIEFDYKVSY